MTQPVEEPDPLREQLEAALGTQYRVLRLLGRGGMGAVYLARDLALERPVAVKVLRESGASSDARERFRREARLAARLSHPHVVPLLAVGEAGDLAYLVMGYVAGESLTARLRREGRLGADEARRILSDVADALAYAHAHGVIHRDVKPDNVLLDDESGRALLADFGIARAAEGGGTLTRDGAIIGTPAYMSPEQIAGRPVDARSDIYSLGVVGYELLSGRRPFEGDTRDVLLGHLNREPEPLPPRAPDAPQDLTAALMRCLGKEPEERWPEAAAFRRAIAPSALEEERLPEPLDGLDGAGLAALVSALLLAATLPHVASTPDAMGVVALAALVGTATTLAKAPLVASGISLARRRGFSRAEIAGALLRQPQWWRLWYPRRWRRPWDVFDRLPTPFRMWRVLLLALAIDGALVLVPALFLLPLADLPDDRIRPWVPYLLGGIRELPARVMTYLTVCAAAVTALAGAAPLVLLKSAMLLRARGLDTYTLRTVARALLYGPTGDRSLWRKPELAAVLLASRDASSSPRAWSAAARRLLGTASPDEVLLIERGMACAERLVERQAETRREARQLEAAIAGGERETLVSRRARVSAAATPELARWRDALDTAALALDALEARRSELAALDGRLGLALEALTARPAPPVEAVLRHAERVAFGGVSAAIDELPDPTRTRVHLEG